MDPLFYTAMSEICDEFGPARFKKGRKFQMHIKLLMSKISLNDWQCLSDQYLLMRLDVSCFELNAFREFYWV